MKIQTMIAITIICVTTCHADGFGGRRIGHRIGSNGERAVTRMGKTTKQYKYGDIKDQDLQKFYSACKFEIKRLKDEVKELKKEIELLKRKLKQLNR